MPTYEYACQRCGPMEIFQSIKEDTMKVCPSCGSKRFRKLISRGGGIIFKGDGFWETDYNRSSDYRQQVDKDRGTTTSTSDAVPSTTPTAATASASSADSQSPSSSAKTTAKSSSTSSTPSAE